MDPEFPDICVKYELLARNERDVQEASVALNYLLRSAFNKRVTFKQHEPECRKIASSANQLGAWPCQTSAWTRNFMSCFEAQA